MSEFVSVLKKYTRNEGYEILGVYKNATEVYRIWEELNKSDTDDYVWYEVDEYDLK